MKAYRTKLSRERFKTNLEWEYAGRLESELQSGKISDWRYEPFNVRLSNGTFYKVDWLVVTGDVISLHETKGHHKNMRESVTKWRIAAELYPWFRWVFALKRRGKWEITEFPKRPKL